MAQIPDAELDRLVGLGFDSLWLMGVWRSGPRALAQAIRHWSRHWREQGDWSQRDVVASPFAIADYSFSQEVGSPADFELFQDRLRQRGLGMVVDFVPNHAGLDCSLIADRPELFLQSNRPGEGFAEFETVAGTLSIAHGKDPHFAAWEDTVQFDLRNPEVWRLHRETVAGISRLSCAIRVDMAMLCLGEVFERTWRGHPARTEPPAGANPLAEIFRMDDGLEELRPTALAEVYWDLEPRVLDSGLGLCYLKRVYDYLVQRDHAGLIGYLRDNQRLLASGVFFLENHDEARIASLLTFEEHRLAALLIHTLPGISLTHWGQIEGRRRFTPCILKRRPTEEPDRKLEAFYRDLLGFAKRLDERVGCAQYSLPTVQAINGRAGMAAHCHALFRWDGSRESGKSALALVLIHFGLEPLEVFLEPPSLPPLARLNGIDLGFSTDRGAKSEARIEGGRGIFARLDPGSGIVLVIEVDGPLV